MAKVRVAGFSVSIDGFGPAPIKPLKIPSASEARSSTSGSSERGCSTR